MKNNTVAKKIIRIVSNCLLVALFLLVVFMFFARATGNTPSIFGLRVYFVASGSMEPEISVGDAVLVKKTDAESIHKGDIITYRSVSGEMRGQPITHRVVAEPEVKDGVYYYQTQGDALGAPLDPVTSYNNVEGKFVMKLPLIGKAYSFFCQPYGLITFVAVIIVLFGYEMISMFISYRSLDKIDEEYDKLSETDNEKDA